MATSAQGAVAEASGDSSTCKGPGGVHPDIATNTPATHDRINGLPPTARQTLRMLSARLCTRGVVSSCSRMKGAKTSAVSSAMTTADGPSAALPMIARQIGRPTKALLP